MLMMMLIIFRVCQTPYYEQNPSWRLSYAAVDQDFSNICASISKISSNNYYNSNTSERFPMPLDVSALSEKENIPSFITSSNVSHTDEFLPPPPTREIYSCSLQPHHHPLVLMVKPITGQFNSTSSIQNFCVSKGEFELSNEKPS